MLTGILLFVGIIALTLAVTVGIMYIVHLTINW